MSRPARGVVVAHGEVARAMVDAVRRIAGDGADALEALSNDGLGPTELRATLDGFLGDAPGIVFVDLQSGSCGMAALQSCRERSDRAVVCGVNLPMLLDFVFHRNLPIAELAGRAVERGRDAVAAPLSRG